MGLVNFVGRRLCFIVSVVVGVGAHQALAANSYFDTNGATPGSGATTANGMYTWENNWSTDGTGSIATTDWTDGDFARFSAGTDAGATNFTVTANVNHTVAGMALQTNGGGIVTLATASGAVFNLASNPGGQGFFVGGVAAQGLTITGTVAGDAITPLYWSGALSGTSGSLFLYGNNTYAGGTVLNTGAGLNFNNNNSFGTGPITYGATLTSAVLANPTVGNLVINNPVTMRDNAAGNISMLYTGVAPVTFNNWTLGTQPGAFANVITVGNNSFQSAKMIINNLAGAAASNLIVQAQTGVNGTLVLTGTSTYGGTTQIGGNTALATGQPTLQADDGSSLPSSSFLILNGGVLQTSGSFTRDVNSGNFGGPRMEWNTNGGGFSAIGSQLTVDIGANNGNAGLELPWSSTVGSGIVGPLKFGSVSSNAKVLWIDPVDLAASAGTTRTITVTAGTGGDSTEMNQVIRNSAGVDTVLQKNGNGTLLLSAANTYTGTTQISGGALQAVQGVGLPTADLVSLDGGVYEGVGATSFTRALGTSGSTVQWTTNGGGFSANGGQMTVNIGGAGAQVVWGATVGSQIVGPLIFGSHTANAKTVFTNPIDMNNSGTAATRTITVNSGAGGDSAEISSVLSNSNATALLTKNGAGTLTLSAANTYTGGTTVSAGTLALNNVAALPSTGTLTLGGGTLSNVSGSAIVAPNTVTLTASSTIGGTSSFTFNGSLTNSGGNRTLTVSNTAGTTLGAVNLSEAAATGRTLTVSGNGNLTISGPIQNASAAGAGNGALTFNSGFHGTATLSGANTYSGATTINGGTVLVTNTSGSATGTGAVTTASGTTLGGTGTIGGNVTNKGILSPGVAGIGTLSIGGKLTDSAGSSWSIDLSGASADKVAVTGNIDLTAADTLNVTGAGTGSSWLIGTYGGTLTGTFDTVTSGYTVSYAGGNITLNIAGPPSLPGDYNQNGIVDAADYVLFRNNLGQPAGTLPNDPAGGTIGTAQYDQWKSNFGNHPGAGSGLGGSAVPEPATIGLMLIGLGAALAGRRR